MRLQTERRAARLFQWSLALLLCLGAWQCRNGWPVAFDLMALVPSASKHDTPLRQLAEARVQAPLSRQMLALVAHADGEQALAAARDLAQRWRVSGLFTQVDLHVELDMTALRTQLLAQRLALLPEDAREQLLRNPAEYSQQRAAAVTNPFVAMGLVPLAQDWLGLAHQAQHILRPASTNTLRYDLTSDTLQMQAGDKTWILLRAHTYADAFTVSSRDASDPVDMAVQIAQDRAVLAAQGVDFLVAGGPLYAAQGRAQATREISLIGGIATVGIILVLLLALRHARALLALVPVAVGLLTGAVVCVAVFGSIHLLTLLIGASLIGVAVDFPLHWLGKSYGMHPWRAQAALRRVRLGLTLSLAASLIGYLALLFTPFVALSQTAVFSASGLVGAYLCTRYQLPVWMRDWQPRPWPPLLRLAQALLRMQTMLAAKRKRVWLLVLLLTLGTVGGMQRVSLHDDLRQWLSLPPELLQDARHIGDLTEFVPTSQFFLVQAPDADELLRRQATLARELDTLVERGVLGGYNALSQLIAPLTDQRALQTQLAALTQQPDVWQPLIDVGISWAVVQAELHAAQQLPLVSIDTALQGRHAERWQNLWLGHGASPPVRDALDAHVATQQDHVAGLVTLLNLRDAAALHTLVQSIRIPGVTLIDRSGELNQLFTDTRVSAAQLKLLSYLAAALLLWWGLGRAAVWRVLAVPLLAVVLSVGVLGWLGQPLTLFSLFGLLLVSALGVDYAIFMFEGVAGAAASLVGILLSTVTTLLSFGLLALSQTPVIAGFGLSVALGVAFSLLLAVWVKKPSHHEGIRQHAN